MKAPFPYFGGKSQVADLVWQQLGDVDHYVEPFAGSLAVLLGRPAEHRRPAETVNDIDHYIVNFWRAVRAAPAEVAYWADYPVTEADLTARHLWLITEGRQRIAHLEADPLAYDAQVAGWWVWGISCWIGSGWCRGDGPWTAQAGRLVRRKTAETPGVSRQRPHLGDAGQGVHRLDLTADGKAAEQPLPYLGGRPKIYAYMAALAERLRRVRVCCGDWQRVLTRGALAHGRTVGIFLDPPYAYATGRDTEIYAHEASELSAAVREWALAHGADPRLRIVLCGYAGEHVMPSTWREVRWTARPAYKTSRGDQTGNRFRERLWFSPHCLATPALFDTLTVDLEEEDATDPPFDG